MSRLRTGKTSPIPEVKLTHMNITNKTRVSKIVNIDEMAYIFRMTETELLDKLSVQTGCKIKNGWIHGYVYNSTIQVALINMYKNLPPNPVVEPSIDNYTIIPSPSIPITDIISK